MAILKVATHTVKPAEATPQEVIHLSECDQIKPLTHTPTVYFFSPHPNIHPSEIVEILKVTLSMVLVKFYPLAGRLQWTDNGGEGGGRVELHCNSMGALMVEAESDDLEMDDFQFQDFCPTPEMASLVPCVDFGATPLHEVPVLTVQFTKLRCGGVVLGTGISHVVADGQSAANFVTAWSKVAFGDKADDSPFFYRKVLQNKGIPDLNHSDFFPMPLFLGKSDNLEDRKMETAAIMLKLSEEQVGTLQTKANQDLEHSQPFSPFEAISAHIWKSLSMARGLKPEQETVLFATVDFRDRMNPPLPKTYFGNAAMALPVRSTVGELVSNPLSYGAGAIRKAVDGLTEEYVRSYLNCIDNISDVSSMRRSYGTVGNGNPNLIITSWVGLRLCGARFWGDHVYMGPASLGGDGRAFLMASQNGDGSFLVPLCLQVDHAEDFEKHFYAVVEPDDFFESVDLED